MRRNIKYLAAATLLSLCSAVVAFPQDPTPQGPVVNPLSTVVVRVPTPEPVKWQDEKFKSNELVRLKTADGKAARWEVVDPATADLSSFNEGKECNVSVKGKSALIFVIQEQLVGRLRLTKDGETPDPDPNPTPEPDDGKKPKPHPQPSPGGKVKAFVVVEDTLKPTIGRGEILGSAKVQSTYKQLGLEHRLISWTATKDSLDDIGNKYLTHAKASGLEPPIFIGLDGPLTTGKIIETIPCPKDVDGFCGALAQAVAPRKMGLIFPENGKLKAVWGEFGDPNNPAVPMIPRAQWKEVDYSNFLPPVYDQDGKGQCASSSACTAVEVARNIAGMPYVHFSAGDLYSRVNGGRDDGSMLEDNMAELLKNGACEAKLVPYVWDGRRHNDAAVVANRGKYKVLEVYVCPTFDALVSALQQGFVGQEGLMWYNNFTPDRDGWLPRGRGQAGGHALMAYGAVQNPKTGEWGIKTRNSWTDRWGINGNCIIPESAFGREIGGFWVIRAVTETAYNPFSFRPFNKVSHQAAREFQAGLAW